MPNLALIHKGEELITLTTIILVTPLPGFSFRVPCGQSRYQNSPRRGCISQRPHIDTRYMGQSPRHSRALFWSSSDVYWSRQSLSAPAQSWRSLPPRFRARFSIKNSTKSSTSCWSSDGNSLISSSILFMSSPLSPYCPKNLHASSSLHQLPLWRYRRHRVPSAPSSSAIPTSARRSRMASALAQSLARRNSWRRSIKICTKASSNPAPASSGN